MMRATATSRSTNPARIVSIGGAITEILYALGFEDRLAGVDATSLYPPAALRDKPNVGYMRQLSAEGVLGLNPSLVLAMQGSGPKETMDVLEAAKVPLVMVPETFSEAGPARQDQAGRPRHGRRPARRMPDAPPSPAISTQLRELRGKVTKPVRVMFVMSLLNGRAMAAGQNTAANEIIQLAGAVNAIDGYDGYKIINDEAIVAAKPDVVLSIAARQGFARGGRGLRPSRFRADAGRGQQVLHLDGRPLSARLRAAHGRRRARPRGQALSGVGTAGGDVRAGRADGELPAMRRWRPRRDGPADATQRHGCRPRCIAGPVAACLLAARRRRADRAHA